MKHQQERSLQSSRSKPFRKRRKKLTERGKSSTKSKGRKKKKRIKGKRSKTRSSFKK
jgi:hypothetical protein